MLTTASLIAASLTACGEDESGESLTLVSPAPGDVVALPFEVLINTSAPLGPPHEGLHHLHIWFGDDVAAQLIGEDRVVRINNAPDGEHEMHISLRHADHSAAGADITVKITISGGIVG